MMSVNVPYVIVGIVAMMLRNVWEEGNIHAWQNYRDIFVKWNC